MLQGRIAHIIDADVSRQIAKVLRLTPGTEVVLLDGAGFEYVTKLTRITQREVSGEIMQRQINHNEPELKITLYQSMLKKDKLEWVLQKCTEVGVSAFVPLHTERSEKLGFKEERAKIIIREAAEQSERGYIPELLGVQDFRYALKRASSAASTIVLHMEGGGIGNYMPREILYAVNVFVGPEGGWSEAELDIVRELVKEGRPIKMVSLGPRILRGETAGLVASGILLNR